MTVVSAFLIIEHCAENALFEIASPSSVVTRTMYVLYKL